MIVGPGNHRPSKGSSISLRTDLQCSFDGGKLGRFEPSIQIARHAFKKKHATEKVRAQESSWV